MDNGFWLMAAAALVAAVIVGSALVQGCRLIAGALEEKGKELPAARAEEWPYGEPPF